MIGDTNCPVDQQVIQLKISIEQGLGVRTVIDHQFVRYILEVSIPHSATDKDVVGSGIAPAGSIAQVDITVTCFIDRAGCAPDDHILRTGSQTAAGSSSDDHLM